MLKVDKLNALKTILVKRPRILILLLGLVVSLVCFEEVMDDVFYDPLEGDREALEFDRMIMNHVTELRLPLLTQAMTDLTALGSISVVLTLFLVMASVLYSFRDFKGMTYLFSVLLGAGLWPLFLKPLFARARPDSIEHLVNVTDLSFPSGHSFGAAAVYLGLSYYAGQHARTWPQEVFFYILGGVLIFLIGLTRIYLGVHYPTDVLAGISGGLAWGFMVSLVFELTKLADSRNQSV